MTQLKCLIREAEQWKDNLPWEDPAPYLRAKDLLPLRMDYDRTREYIQKHFGSDEQKVQEIELEDGSVYLYDPKDAYYYDISRILDVISEEKSFSYATYILRVIATDLVASPSSINVDSQVIRQAMLDELDFYPLDNLDDYLEFEVNEQQYDWLIRGEYWPDENERYLDYFNRVYQLLDEFRDRKLRTTELKDFIREQKFDSDVLAYWTWKFIIQLIDIYKSTDEPLRRCQRELLRVVDRLGPLVIKPEPVAQPTFVSPICLNKKRGFKINFIRVVNVLIELGFFVGLNGERITKKIVFHLLAILLNDPTLENYDKDLSNSMQNSNAIDKQSIIFDEMKQKHQEIYNSK